MNELISGGRTHKESIEVVKFIENFYKRYKKFPSKEEIYKRAILENVRKK